MDLSTRQGRREQGLLIQKAVEKAGLSVEELATRIGCSRALIYQYLSGTTLAQPDRLQQIAAETDVTLPYFYGASLEEGRKGRRGGEGGDPHARLDERIRQLEELARAQETPPDWSALASTCEKIATLASQMDDDGAEARALLRLGKARVRMGEFTRATDSLYESAQIFAATEDAEGEADARQTLGNALLATGRSSDAREQFEWCEKSASWSARWCGAVSLAAVAEQQGDYRQAMERCDEAAAILEESSDKEAVARGMLYVNGNRTNLYMACGDFKSAEGLAQRCMDEAEAQGNSDQHLEARLNLGVCALYQGRWVVAKRTLSSALQLARFIGDKGREAMARATLAILLAALCDCDNCIQQAKDALAAALSQGDHRSELFAQMALADAYANMGRISEARYHASQALGVASALRLMLYEADCRLRIARLCLINNDLEEAQEPIERALATSRQLGARHLEATACLLLGDLALRRGNVADAEKDAQQSIKISQELGLVPTEWEAAGLIARIECANEPPRFPQAEQAAEKAVELMESVRADLREAGIADTILEDNQRQDIYLLRARLLIDAGRPKDAHEFIEQIGWPPLLERLERTGRGKGQRA
jgi:tetratricopeptide (TPR) repeat protein